MEKIVFSKYSNERSPEFAIRTDICIGDEGYFVRKSGCTSLSQMHMENLYQCYQKLRSAFEQTEIKVNECLKGKNGLEFEYVQGCTLEEILDSFIGDKDYHRLEEVLEQYIEQICSVADEAFTPTEKFQNIFGTFQVDSINLKSCSITDIDMVANNILINDSWTLIDYEWTFDFPIPINFVVFRIIHYYFETTHMRRRAAENWGNVYAHFGISPEECDAYYKMEQSFQNYITEKHEPLRYMQARMSPGAISIWELVTKYQKQQHRVIQMFWSMDGIIREKDSKRYTIGENGFFHESVEFPENVNQVRIDPGENPCIVRILKFQVNQVKFEQQLCKVNGCWLGESQALFGNPDPQIVLYYEDEIKTLEISLEICDTDSGDQMISFLNEGVMDMHREYDNLLERYQTQRKEIVEKDRRYDNLLERHQIQEKEAMDKDLRIADQKVELEKYRQKLMLMENTKVWKAYRKFRQIKEGK